MRGLGVTIAPHLVGVLDRIASRCLFVSRRGGAPTGLRGAGRRLKQKPTTPTRRSAALGAIHRSKNRHKTKTYRAEAALLPAQ